MEPDSATSAAGYNVKVWFTKIVSSTACQTGFALTLTIMYPVQLLKMSPRTTLRGIWRVVVCQGDRSLEVN